jgi:site-specific recombinase XerD
MKQATSTTIISADQATVLQPTSTADVLDQLATFLRINIAAGDASENTIRAYLSHVGQFVEWCWNEDLDPGRATETHLAEYRHYLSSEAGYKRSTIGVKLSALRRFYQAAVWRGLRPDNPAEG